MRSTSKASRAPYIIAALLLILLVAAAALFLKENRSSSTVEKKLESLQVSYEELREKLEVLTSEKEKLSIEKKQLENEISKLSETLKEKDIESLNQKVENLRLTEALSSEREKRELFVYKGLVRVLDIDASLSIDLKYATDDNFTGQSVYPIDAPALLTLETALKLKRANERFKKDGYRIRIWDGYRPRSV